MRQRRKRNSEPLCGSYYHAMDALYLPKVTDIKSATQLYSKWNKNYTALHDLRLLGYGNEITPWDEDDGETLTKEIETLAACSREEYDKWMKSVKYQFDIGTLVNVMPPNVTVSDFFKDIVVRIPNEQTLVIKEHGMFTVMVSMEEYPKNEKHNEIREANARAIRDIRIGHQYFDSHYQFEFDSWVKCTLTFSSHLSPHHLREDLPHDVKQRLLGRKSVFFPFDFWVPIGNQITVERLDALMPIPIPKEGLDENMHLWNKSAPILYSHLYMPNRLQDAGIKPIINQKILDEAEKYIPKKQLTNGEKELTEAVKQNEQKIKEMGVTSSVWAACDMVINAVKSIGILFNPDFKEACVKTVLRGTIKPNNKFYSQDNPFKKLPQLKPKFEHYVVTLDIPDDVSTEPKYQGNKKRMHLVRGHLMRSKGKNAVNGFVWRKSHWRGNKEVGVVTKDYIVNINENVGEIHERDIKKTGT